MTPNETLFWAAAIGFLIGFLLCWIAYVHPKREVFKPLSSVNELRGKLSYLRAEYAKLSGADRDGQVGSAMYYDMRKLMREVSVAEEQMASYPGLTPPMRFPQPGNCSCGGDCKTGIPSPPPPPQGRRLTWWGQWLNS